MSSYKCRYSWKVSGAMTLEDQIGFSSFVICDYCFLSY